VTLAVPTEDLGYYHPQTDTSAVDVGQYTLYVGAAASDICAAATLTLTA
jgi:hypothetical protein